MKIYINKIQCNHCKDIIESTHVHDFKYCGCGRVAVDGGRDYLKRMFLDLTDIIELAVYEETS